VIGHMILFRPKPDLAPAERETLVAAFEHALTEIPGIASSRVGRRVRLGRQYDLHNAQDYPFAAFIEFATEEALRAYLDHPAHRDLGRLFYQTAENALAFDFELIDSGRVRELL
jgi:Stress responsive A/B Barrel Domain